jgi:hypothetical protein
LNGKIIKEDSVDRIKDAQVIRLIEKIGEHYRANISNRFLRPVLLQLQIDKSTWDMIEVLTEKMELYRYQGFHLDELYRQIAACARFVEVARNKSNIKSKMNAIPSGGADKILRDMAVSNFSSNLQVWADLLNELFVNLVEFDKGNSGERQPVYTQMSELYNVGRLLVGH